MGKKRYPNRDVYEGEFLDGVREGNGKLTYHQKGDVYVGEFQNNMFHGFGVYSWGDFLENGVWVRGRRYEGSWAKGRRFGDGIYFSGYGDSYDGHWEADFYEGEGTLTKKNGDRMTGHFSRGKLAGEATIDYINGDKYSGSMRGASGTGRESSFTPGIKVSTRASGDTGKSMAAVRGNLAMDLGMRATTRMESLGGRA